MTEETTQGTPQQTPTPPTGQPTSDTQAQPQQPAPQAQPIAPGQPQQPFYQAQPMPQTQPQTQASSSPKPNTLLKVMSILSIVGGALSFIMAIFMFVAAGLIGSGSFDSGTLTFFQNYGIPTSDVSTVIFVILIVLGVFLIVAGVFNLLMGIFGIKGKYTPALVLGIISAVCAAIGLIATIYTAATGSAGGGGVGAQIVAAAISGLYLAGVITSRDSN